MPEGLLPREGMLRLDDDSLLAALAFLSLEELLRAELVCRRVRELSLSSDAFWRRRLVRQFGSSLRNGSIEGPLRSLAVQILSVVGSDPLFNLLEDVVAASSVDREEESPRNVLHLSRCYLYSRRRLQAAQRRLELDDFGLALLQMHCGCANSQPCYWSSRPSRSPERVEFLELRLVVAVGLVTSVSITPYQAFFQPGAPVYAPRTVVLKFRDSEGRCYFESERLPVENLFLEQTLLLPQPALFLGGTLVLELCQMRQRQTIEGMDDYYMCLSHLRVHGLEIPSFEAVSSGGSWWVTELALPRSGWADRLIDDDSDNSLSEENSYRPNGVKLPYF